MASGIDLDCVYKMDIVQNVHRKIQASRMALATLASSVGDTACREWPPDQMLLFCYAFTSHHPSGHPSPVPRTSKTLTFNLLS